MRYDYHSPDVVRNCQARSMSAGCGVVVWDTRETAELNAPYYAQVESEVRLAGPGGVIAWRPIVNCMLRDIEGRRRDVMISTAGCQTQLSKVRERMEWAIGGEAVGDVDGLMPGEYTGVVALSITRGRQTFSDVVPITYTVHELMRSCQLTVSGSMSVSGLPPGASGTYGVNAKDGTATGCVTDPCTPKDDLNEEIDLGGYTGISMSRGSIRVILTGAVADATLSVDVDQVLTGPGGKTVGWHPQFGYTDTSGKLERTSLTPGAKAVLPLSETQVSNGGRDYWIGGLVDVRSTDNTVDGETYTGTYTIELTC